MKTLRSARLGAEAIFAIYLPDITNWKYLVSHFPFFFSKYTQKNWWGITQWDQFSHTLCSSNQLSLLEKELIPLAAAHSASPWPSAVSLLYWPLPLAKFTPPSYSSLTPEDWPGGQISKPDPLFQLQIMLRVRRAIQLCKGFPGGWAVMNPLALQEPGFDPWVRRMASHSRTCGWEIPWNEEPGWLQSMGSQ